MYVHVVYVYIYIYIQYIHLHIQIPVIAYETTTVKHSCPKLGTKEGYRSSCFLLDIGGWPEVLHFDSQAHYSAAPLDIESDCQFLCHVDDYVILLLCCVLENASSGPCMQEITRL